MQLDPRVRQNQHRFGTPLTFQKLANGIAYSTYFYPRAPALRKRGRPSEERIDDAYQRRYILDLTSMEDYADLMWLDQSHQKRSTAGIPFLSAVAKRRAIIVAAEAKRMAKLHISSGQS